MPVIWCAISAHGLGHAAQVVPVLNELGRLIPGLKAILRTQVPQWFFRNRLTIEWTAQPVQQDVGCIQQGPLWIDVAATWNAHAHFHEQWEQRVHEEVLAIAAAQPTLVLSDISYLAIEAGVRARVPTVGLGNLSWDQVLKPLACPDEAWHYEMIRHIQRAYAQATMMLRPAPGLPMEAFPTILDIGPLSSPPAAVPLNLRESLRETIGASSTDTLVLVAFGGIALDGLPFTVLDQLEGYHFIVSGAVPDRCARVHAASTLPYGFPILLASADVILTKPGYSTVVEAVTLGKPVVYVRRHNFADEPALVDYLHRYGRGVELARTDCFAGRWHKALETARRLPPPATPPPAPTGAGEAATWLAQWF
jgi:hypothetical protein